jgi:hypothetical protein
VASEPSAVKVPGAFAGRPRPRAELVLLVLCPLCLALIPIHIGSIYEGLPAHPLLLHIPVMGIPIATVGALALAVRPAWIDRWGVPLAIVAVVSLAGTVLTIGAGEWLRARLGLTGDFGPGALIARHAHAADILRVLMFAFAPALVLTVLAHRTEGTRRELRIAGRVATVALAIACAYFVFHVGDLGARAVWAGRVNGHGGFPGGGLPGAGGSGPGNVTPQSLFGGGGG